MADTDLDFEELEGIEELLDEGKPKSKGSRKLKPKGTGSSLEVRLREFFKLVGGVLTAFEEFDGQVISDAAPDLAKQLAAVARSSPRAARVLEGLLEGGAWTGVAGVVGIRIALPIAVHHRALPGPVNERLAVTFDIPVREPKPKPEEEGEPEEAFAVAQP